MASTEVQIYSLQEAVEYIADWQKVELRKVDLKRRNEDPSIDLTALSKGSPMFELIRRNPRLHFEEVLSALATDQTKRVSIAYLRSDVTGASLSLTIEQALIRGNGREAALTLKKSGGGQIKVCDTRLEGAVRELRNYEGYGAGLDGLRDVKYLFGTDDPQIPGVRAFLIALFQPGD